MDTCSNLLLRVLQMVSEGGSHLHNPGHNCVETTLEPDRPASHC